MTHCSGRIKCYFNTKSDIAAGWKRVAPPVVHSPTHPATHFTGPEVVARSALCLTPPTSRSSNLKQWVNKTNHHSWNLPVLEQMQPVVWCRMDHLRQHVPFFVGLDEINKDFLLLFYNTLYPLQTAWISTAAWSSLGSTGRETGGLGLAVKKQEGHVCIRPWFLFFGLYVF